eukprot:gene14008-29513_t
MCLVRATGLTRSTDAVFYFEDGDALLLGNQLTNSPSCCSSGASRRAACTASESVYRWSYLPVSSVFGRTTTFPGYTMLDPLQSVAGSQITTVDVKSLAFHFARLPVSSFAVQVGIKKKADYWIAKLPLGPILVYSEEDVETLEELADVCHAGTLEAMRFEHMADVSTGLIASGKAISSDGAGRLSFLDQVRLGSGDAGAAVSPPRMHSLDLDDRERQVDEHARREDAAMLTTSDLSCGNDDETDAAEDGSVEDGEEVSAPVNSDDAGVYTYLVGRDGSLITMRANSNTEPRGGAEDVDTENTSLLEACFRRHYDDALMFLDTGADPNETNEDGLCALYIAAQRNCLEIVKTLISHGADVNLQEEGIGATPLYVAAHLGHATIAEELLRRPDILPNIVTRTDGATPLIVAAAHGHGKVVVELLLHGVDRSCKLTTDGTTAEDCADAAGYTGIVKLLRVDNRLARLQLDRAVSGFVQNGYE